jgi:hypothetical protein
MENELLGFWLLGALEHAILLSKSVKNSLERWDWGVNTGDL